MNNKLFVEDTNKLMLKNKKISITNNDSILKNKFWMNVYEKMKLIIAVSYTHLTLPTKRIV